MTTPCCPHTAADSPCVPFDVAAALERSVHESATGSCDTGRYRLPYFAWGNGPPLVCIPGLADGGGSFRLIASLLSPHFRCVAYDLPLGNGDGANPRRYTHADLVDDLFALLDHLGLGRAYVLGSSFGSTIALAAAHRRPERVPRLILQGGFSHRPLRLAERLLAGPARHWPGRMRSLPLRQTVLRRLHGDTFAAVPPGAWPFFLEQTGLPPIAAVAAHARLLHAVDLRLLLPAIRTPTLVVTGGRDPLVGRTCAETLLHGLPNVAHADLPEAGHFPHFTHSEWLAFVVRRFLTPGAETAACPGASACGLAPSTTCAGATACPVGPSHGVVSGDGKDR